MGLVFDWHELRAQHPTLHIDLAKTDFARVDEYDFQVTVWLWQDNVSSPKQRFWVQVRGGFAKLEENELMFPVEWLHNRLREKLKAVESALRLGAV